MIKHINFTAKDKVNALAGAALLKEFSAKTIHVVGAALDNATDVETGEVKTVAYLVAERNGEKRYFQVCYLLASPETEKREFSPLYQIQDNWPKYVLSLDPILRPRDGIAHENLVSFLLQDT